MLAIDTETTLFSDTEPVPELVLFGVAGRDGAWLAPAHHRQKIVERCAYAFEYETIAMANAPFDVFVLARYAPELWPGMMRAYEQGRIVDVLTRERMFDIATGQYHKGVDYDLGAVAWRRSGIALNKNDEWRLRYGELRGLELEQMPRPAVDYAIADPTATHTVGCDQEHERAQHQLDLFSTANDQARAHLALYAQHPVRGIHTDQRAVDELDARLASEWQHCADIAVLHGLARPGGPKARQKLVRNLKVAASMITDYCQQTGQTVTRTAPTKRAPNGNVKFDEMTLKRLLVPRDHPIDAFRRMGALEALRTRTITLLREPHIRSNYVEAIETARTAMYSPNLQNLNRTGGFRECLVPPPGYVFVISDFSAAELVTLAQIQLDWFGRSKLAEVLREGRDPHAELGATILGISADQFDKSIKEHAEARQLAKAPNFGFPGGLGAKRFCDYALRTYDLWIEEQRARQLKRNWLHTWPEMPDYFARIESFQQPDGTYFIAHPRSGWLRGGCRYTEACNSPYQHLAAMAAKTALWRLFQASMDRQSPLFGAYQVLFVHDENVTCVPRGNALAAMLEQERIMKAAFAQWCPDVPIKVESTIADRYGKG